MPFPNTSRANPCLKKVSFEVDDCNRQSEREKTIFTSNNVRHGKLVLFSCIIEMKATVSRLVVMPSVMLPNRVVLTFEFVVGNVECAAICYIN